MRHIAEIGDVLREKYCLLQEIGSGGEGVVYLARDNQLGKRWCIKIAEKSSGMRLLCRLEHERIPQVVDYWEEEKAVLVMEYIDGCSLADLLEKGSVKQSQGMLWTRQLLQVISYLHSQLPPVVHGDIKPENLLISEEGQLYLIDFGSARGMDEICPKTQKGTGFFAAPEQRKGLCMVQSDIYGIGKVLQLLWENIGTGWHRISPVLKKCLKKEPGERYPDCKSLEEALENSFKKMKQEKQRIHLPLLLAGLLVMFLTGASINGIENEVKSQEKPEISRETAHALAVEYFEETKDVVRKEAFWKMSMEQCESLLEEAGSRERSHILLLMAKLWEARGEWEEAARVYTTWLEENPQGEEGVISYGMMLMRQGQEQESVELYRRFGKEHRKEELDGYNGRIWKNQIEEWEEEEEEEKK